MEMKRYHKELILGFIGGLLYIIIELIWRGYSHWTMFALGGLCFVCMGRINEVIPWNMPLWLQVLIGTVIITVLEFVTGCIVNLWLGWNVWDYSNVPFNILGQICLPYIFLWMPISLTGIVLDDVLRYYLFKEEVPHYNIGLTRKSKKILWLSVA